jgi:hypothetical protein
MTHYFSVGQDNKSNIHNINIYSYKEYKNDTLFFCEVVTLTIDPLSVFVTKLVTLNMSNKKMNKEVQKKWKVLVTLLNRSPTTVNCTLEPEN